MNSRIRRKKAKQLWRAAAAKAADAAMLGERARQLRPTGPITEALRQRALFRSRRYEAEAEETMALAASL